MTIATTIALAAAGLWCLLLLTSPRRRTNTEIRRIRREYWRDR